eukprot:9115647-Pyramimonas_sp.AAC.1
MAGEQDKRIAEAKKVSQEHNSSELRARRSARFRRGPPAATAALGSAVAGRSYHKLRGLRVSALRAEGPLPAGTSVGLRLRASPRCFFRGPWVVHAVEVAKQ